MKLTVRLSSSIPLHERFYVHLGNFLIVPNYYRSTMCRAVLAICHSNIRFFGPWVCYLAILKYFAAFISDVWGNICACRKKKLLDAGLRHQCLTSPCHIKCLLLCHKSWLKGWFNPLIWHTNLIYGAVSLSLQTCKRGRGTKCVSKTDNQVECTLFETEQVAILYHFYHWISGISS